MITLKDIIDNYSIEIPSWVSETMVNFNLMNCSKSLFPKVDEFYAE